MGRIGQAVGRSDVTIRRIAAEAGLTDRLAANRLGRHGDVVDGLAVCGSKSTCFAVFDGNADRVSGYFETREEAQAERARILRRRKWRRCIRCNDPMVSYGPHHRMCESCRASVGTVPREFEGLAW